MQDRKYQDWGRKKAGLEIIRQKALFTSTD